MSQRSARTHSSQRLLPCPSTSNQITTITHYYIIKPHITSSLHFASVPCNYTLFPPPLHSHIHTYIHIKYRSELLWACATPSNLLLVRTVIVLLLSQFSFSSANLKFGCEKKLVCDQIFRYDSVHGDICAVRVSRILSRTSKYCIGPLEK